MCHNELLEGVCDMVTTLRENDGDICENLIYII